MTMLASLTSDDFLNAAHFAATTPEKTRTSETVELLSLILCLAPV